MTKAERDQLSPRLGAVWANVFEDTRNTLIEAMDALDAKTLSAQYEKNKQKILEAAITSADAVVVSIERAEWEMERYT